MYETSIANAILQAVYDADERGEALVEVSRLLESYRRQEILAWKQENTVTLNVDDKVSEYASSTALFDIETYIALKESLARMICDYVNVKVSKSSDTIKFSASITVVK